MITVYMSMNSTVRCVSAFITRMRRDGYFLHDFVSYTDTIEITFKPA